MTHFLSLMDWSVADIAGLLRLAARLKSDPHSRRDALAGKTLAMIFQKPSTRTRVSFEAGMTRLGGTALFLSAADLQLGRGETVQDTARVLARYVDGIMARVFDQEDLNGLTAGGIPVINGLSDRLHPCQALADVFTLQERMGRVEGVSLAYVGDGNNVCHSLVHAAARTGLRLRVATPEGYEPDPAIVAAARDAGADVTVGLDAEEAVSGVDAVYTDVWASMGQEEEAADRRKTFAPYRVDEALFDRAAPDAIFFHCLPAHRGDEVTDGVFEHARSVVFDQAENRLHVQQALLLHLLGGEALNPSEP
ncbi:MAG: ornithine carbamoyltransferase [Planctomycetota bacterium]|jgi:ornithine carbamoyltransferase